MFAFPCFTVGVTLTQRFLTNNRWSIFQDIILKRYDGEFGQLREEKMQFRQILNKDSSWERGKSKRKNNGKKSCLKKFYFKKWRKTWMTNVLSDLSSLTLSPSSWYLALLPCLFLFENSCLEIDVWSEGELSKKETRSPWRTRVTVTCLHSLIALQCYYASWPLSSSLHPFTPRTE